MKIRCIIMLKFSSAWSVVSPFEPMSVMMLLLSSQENAENSVHNYVEIYISPECNISSFELVSVDDVVTLVKKMLSKSCSIDLCPLM